VTFTAYTARTYVAATATINGRDYQVFRVGGCQVDIRAGGEQCTDCGTDHWWNLWGIAPQYTVAELAMPDPKRPRLPYAYASPVKPYPRTRRHGRPEAPIADGWQIRDEMNRVVFGYATSFAEMAQIAAASLRLPTT
jgi:hypothetical protein